GSLYYAPRRWRQRAKRAFYSKSSSELSWAIGLILLFLGSDLMKNPVDGFSAGLVDDSNVFEWSVTIIGPPDTL
ncbi:hypothetical protein BHE74_00055370, partial [Ensete ventricosum]